MSVMRLALLFLALCGCTGIEQSTACVQYLGCLDAIADGGSAAYASSYGPNGTCWSTDQRSADNCSAACTQGRQFLSFGAGMGKPECR